jgi:hypothetical protein
VVRTGSERGRRGLDLTLLRRDRARALRDLGEAAARLIEQGIIDPRGELREPFARLRDADLRMQVATDGTQYGDAVHEAFLSNGEDDDFTVPGAVTDIDEIFERTEPVTLSDRPAKAAAPARKPAKKRARKPTKARAKKPRPSATHGG